MNSNFVSKQKAPSGSFLPPHWKFAAPEQFANPKSSGGFVPIRQLVDNRNALNQNVFNLLLRCGRILAKAVLGGVPGVGKIRAFRDRAFSMLGYAGTLLG
jgi:hypothetical protein